MQTLSHLTKRGNVYQWRRRSRQLSTGIVDFKLSLGTTDLATARTLSRKLSAESDTIMGQLLDRRITPLEARQWLALVVRREHEKIEKLELLRHFDCPDPSDDLRHDETTCEVWQHLAADGLHADSPIVVKDTHLFEQAINMTRADLMSDARRRIVARDFREITGRDDISAMEIATLMNLLIEGKAAAWRRHKNVLRPLANIADEMCERELGLMGSDVATAPLNPKPTESLETPARVNTPTALVQQQVHDWSEYEQSDTTTHMIVESTQFDTSIAAVVQRMVQDKRAENTEEKTLRQYESFASLFTCLTAVVDLRLLQQHHIKAFRADLARLPKSWGKSPKDRGANREEIMSRASRLPPEKIGLAVGTINRHLEHLGQIVEWALDEGIQLNARLNPTKLRRKDDTRDRDKKEAFTEGQLVHLFEAPVWTGSKSERFQTLPGPKVYKNGIYWCPIIGAYTGARREEIAGLGIDDIIIIDGIPCFSIEDSEIRRIKNESSRRIVPIHQRLVETGFLNFVERSKESGKTDLFPGLREPKTGQHGRKLGRRMRQIIDGEFGPNGVGLSFHSLRHYVQNFLEDNSDVSDKVIRDIVGHEGKDVHQKTYSKRAPTPTLRDAINLLPAVF